MIVTSTAFGELPALVGRAPLARQQDADPELLGRRRHVLAAEEPGGDELLRGHVRVRLRRRPEQGGACAREAAARRAPAASSPAPAAIDGVATAIRRSGGSTNGAALAATLEKFKKVPTLSGQRELLDEVPQRLRPAVPRDQDREQQGALRRRRDRQGRPEDLGPVGGRRHSGRRRGGPGARSGPPPSRGPSPACGRSTGSRSSCTGTRSSG